MNCYTYVVPKCFGALRERTCIKKAILTRELDLIYEQLRQGMHMDSSSSVLDRVATHDNATEIGQAL